MLSGKMIVLFAAIILLLLGLIFGVASVAMSVSTKQKRKVCTRKTTGTVTDVEKSVMNGSVGEAPMYSWHPVFTYEVNGYTITKRSSYGNAGQDFYVGQTVTVYYNPDNPNEYYVEEEKVSSVQRIFAVISAVVFLAGGAALAVYIRFMR